MFTYRKATPEEMPELLDLANYVFSQASVPHDFAKLLPKVYGTDAPYDAAEQFIAKRDDGRIRALVALRHMMLTMPGDALHVGFVGTVSVHPYSRGEGHMKQLMALMTDQARQQNVDLLVLGGQRQRYQYFGFEKGGYRYQFRITGNNVRHALRDVPADDITFADMHTCAAEQLDMAYALYTRKAVRIDRAKEHFADILRSWANEACIVLKSGEMIGYIAGNGMEIELTEESLLPAVIKAMMAQRSLKDVTIYTSPWETERVASLAAFAEGWSINHPDMVHVLNWKHTLQALLTLRAQYMPLADGRCVIAIDGTAYEISVTDGIPSVQETDAPAQLALTGMEAQQLLFGMERFTMPHPLFANWLPLPMNIAAADAF